MIINDVIFNCELADIITELQTQLALNNIPLLQKTRDNPNNIMVCCPYHMERRPSAGIRKTDGMFHCFACQETHSLQELISHCFGHTEDIIGKFGWTWLLKNFATMQVEERKDVRLDFDRDSISSNSKRHTSTSNGLSKSSGVLVTEEELDSYRYYHPYWEKRGVTDEAIIELFDLGYDKSSRSITMPVRNIMGETLFVARRSVDTKFFNYPEGVTKPLYGLYELWQSHKKNISYMYEELKPFEYLKFPKEVAVCESMIDCLRLWQNKIFAVALNGLGNELQFIQLRELPCRKLILATDNDKAGLKARQRIRDNVKNKIITEYILPEGRKDIGECTDDEIKNLQEVF